MTNAESPAVAPSVATTVPKLTVPRTYSGMTTIAPPQPGVSPRRPPNSTCNRSLSSIAPMTAPSVAYWSRPKASTVTATNALT
jgi:hypothetical protein